MADYTQDELLDFIRESNRIEGILREPTDDEVWASRSFLDYALPDIGGMCHIVKVFQPGAELRGKPGLNVRVGDHVPLPGGPVIVEKLEGILNVANLNLDHPYRVHRRYETLHPFTDGNGRSGRLLWAWQMLRFDYALGLKLGFLHAWYYQSLQHG